MPKAKTDKLDPEALLAKNRVVDIIDAIPPADLVASIKRAPSLRGMILGYIAEEMFEKHLPEKYRHLRAENIAKHDDHDRSVDKSDRTIRHNGRLYRIQLKSIQTNSICRNLESGFLQADIQNDAFDKRDVHLPNGNNVSTTCYKRGDYDILAVPLFPFTGNWTFAYKRNIDCKSTTSNKYSERDREYLLSTTERITWPLDKSWHSDIMDLLYDSIGILP